MWVEILDLLFRFAFEIYGEKLPDKGDYLPGTVGEWFGLLTHQAGNTLQDSLAHTLLQVLLLDAEYGLQDVNEDGVGY